jgi:nucleotide-binding universal stress UspA family protein
MKILLAVDGSPCSDAAVEEIGRRPWPQGSIVKVLNAFDQPLPVSPEGWALPQNYFEEIDQAVRTRAQSIVEKAVDQLSKMGNKTITIEGQFVPGSPRALILDEAESWGANLVVVGSHGYSRWERFLLGSVSQSVVSHAKCSVEVVRCAPKSDTERPVQSESESK